MHSPLITQNESSFQDSFTYHWNHCVRHINIAQPSEHSVETAFSHARQVIVAVADEPPVEGFEPQGDYFNATSFGPLLSTLINDRFLDSLLVWVEGAPAGNLSKLRDLQRKNLLDLFDYVITQSRQPVLTEISVLRPLLQFLYKLSSQLKPSYAQLYVQTLHSLCVLLCRSTQFFEFCKNLSDDLFGQPFMVISLLVPLIHRGDKVGDCAKDAMLLILFLSKEDSILGDYLAFGSDFCPVLAASLSGLYSSLPKKLVSRHLSSKTDQHSSGGPVTLRTSATLHSGSPVSPFLVELPVGGAYWHQLSDAECGQSDDLRQILNTLEFCDLVVKVSHRHVQTQLLQFINSGFLIPVLSSALNQSALNEVVAATAYLELFLRHLTGSKMIKLFLQFIITGTHDSAPLLMSLITRLKANAELGMVTLSLFRTILGFHSEDVMYELVFKYLIPLHQVVQLPLSPYPPLNVSHQSRSNFSATPTTDTVRSHLSLNQLAVDLLHSGDRLVSLATTTTFSKSSPVRPTAHSESSSVDGSTSRTPPELSEDQLLSDNLNNLNLSVGFPDFQRYLSSASHRIRICQTACRFWKLSYTLIDCSAGESHLALWSDSELASFELRNSNELHASPVKHAVDGSSNPVQSRDSSLGTVSATGFDSSQSFDFSSLYQLSYLNDFSDEEVDESAPLASASSVAASNSPGLDQLGSKQDIVCDAVQTPACTCKAKLVELVSPIGPDGDQQNALDKHLFEAFIRELSTVNLPWYCPVHFGHFPSLCTIPPLDAYLQEYLDFNVLSREKLTFTVPSVDIFAQIDEKTLEPSTTCKPSAGDISGRRSTAHVSGIGPFLSVLLDRMRNLHTNCLFTNLLLTDLFTALASYPCPLLQAVLLDSVGFQPKSNVNSVYKVLHSVRSQISATAALTDQWCTLITRARLYFARDRFSLPDTIIDPQFYSMRNRMLPRKTIEWLGEPIPSVSSSMPHRTLSPLLPVHREHLYKSSPKPLCSTPHQSKTFWDRASSAVAPLNRASSRSRKSTSSLTRHQASRTNPDSPRNNLAGFGSDSENEIDSDSEIPTRLRNLVFSSLIFDEFCYELAALCYSHSLYLS